MSMELVDATIVISTAMYGRNAKIRKLVLNVLEAMTLWTATGKL